jgi:hypothetical protein
MGAGTQRPCCAGSARTVGASQVYFGYHTVPALFAKIKTLYTEVPKLMKRTGNDRRNHGRDGDELLELGIGYGMPHGAAWHSAYPMACGMQHVNMMRTLARSMVPGSLHTPWQVPDKANLAR